MVEFRLGWWSRLKGLRAQGAEKTPREIKRAERSAGIRLMYIGVSGFGFRVSGFGFMVSGFGFRV